MVTVGGRLTSTLQLWFSYLQPLAGADASSESRRILQLHIVAAHISNPLLLQHPPPVSVPTPVPNELAFTDLLILIDGGSGTEHEHNVTNETIQL